MNRARKILQVLERMGVQVREGRVSKADLERVLAADLSKLSSPAEWLVSTDLGFEVPQHYQQVINRDFETHGRMANPATYKVARFSDGENKVDGVLYQYSYRYNPRNIKYAYKLFLNGQMVSQHAGIRSVLEAEAACEKAARELLSMARRL